MPLAYHLVELGASWGYCDWQMVALWLGLITASLVALVWAAFRSRELFVLTVQAGKTRVVRGKPPHGLLQDLADVFERAGVQRAEVKVVREAGKPRLVASG
ncbi:MAG TPA: DUF3634 family protein, partial [Polyangiales bacterium]